jgi:hypothetical protein
MSQKQLTHLGNRVLHHFLRHYAANLPRKTMHYACEYLSGAYRLKRFRAFLDVA